MERTGARPGAPPGGPLRAVRAALFTALCLTPSASSHVPLSRTPVALSALLPWLLRTVATLAFRPLLPVSATPAAVRRRARPVHLLPRSRPLHRLGHSVVRRGPPRPVPAAAR
ncbi:hypothetical protein [Streptomyces sp. NPDC017529]|uniref:hypothetical protein n=1 Tax=Streptomyces sp. NPDC017529 TaxID=3365000 RepID=UPI00379246F4